MSDKEKADIYVQIDKGLHSLVWDLLISNLPQNKIEEYVKQEKLTIAQYTDLIDECLKNPQVPAEISKEVMKVLQDIENLLKQNNIN